MAFIILYPKGSLSIEPLKNAVFESDIKKISNVVINNDDLANVTVSIDEEVIAKVSSLHIWIKRYSVTRRNKGVFKWWYEIGDKSSSYSIFPTKLFYPTEYSINNEIVLKLTSNCNESLIVKLLRFFIPIKKYKSPNPRYSSFIKVEFDESKVDWLFAFCVLYKEICLKYD